MIRQVKQLRAMALVVALSLAAAAGLTIDAQPGDAQGTGGIYSGPSPAGESTKDNPCLGPQRRELLCPDLKISRPSELYIDTFTRPGRVLLRATNNIRSRGDGPAEIRGIRISGRTMRVNQRIHRKGGGRLSIRTTGNLDFYPIPGQGSYWKYRDAAAFEIWTVGRQDRPLSRVRRGPKLHYCLRDLFRTLPGDDSPDGRVYPACSQDPSRRAVVLGTSVGWSDIYPASYHQNWINVTGLRGCFAFFHIVDPKNHIRELNERNNRSNVSVMLPSGRTVPRC